jgi:dipeptidyl aminopeptidase/acylaminoacyl peptidase
VPEGTTRRLTAGLLSTMPGSIHPDGNEILYLRSHESYEAPPYGKMEYVILNLKTMETDSLFTLAFGGTARFSPDGNRILVMGGPNDFDGLGVNVPDTAIANDYDTQAYIYHRKTGEIEAITREFAPSVSDTRWDETGRYIYLVATDAAFERIYRYDTRNRSFRKYEGGPDVVHSLALARNRSVAVVNGSGASDTPKAWVIDFTRRNPQARVLHDPGADAYEIIRFGEVKNWTFTSDRGEQIDGHVYYPPDFDPERTWPVIVYYYGGTTPVSRAFAGRYPKELYASKGYLVYVVQPSGATGYGQEFSARHVNDWGKIAGDEIIQGTRAFLEAHSYADAKRVGAIGASYGGFMTMYLLTQTDLFAAAVSHAGISNLASYWGEGFWGYQYSGVATAGSYPWNRHDIYVGRSPVFHADRIHTPLLLVTGMSDTNVPPGESLQMFTALKLLGRDVAFVAVEDQDHHILDFNKFILWKDAILSWFDKWLKDESLWWETRFGG